MTFLDRNGFRITDSWFVTPVHRFAVRDLREVWAMSGPRDPIALHSAKAAAVVLVLGGLASPYLDFLGWLGFCVALAVTVVIGLAALRTRPRRQELWARYQGMALQIFGSDDPVWFNQVCRALNRARQVNDDLR